jgi:hypothetical protein
MTPTDLPRRLPPPVGCQLPSLSMIAAIVVGAQHVACFSVPVNDGDFQCGVNDSCPDGQYCASDKVCRTGTEPGPPAGSGAEPPAGSGGEPPSLSPSNIDRALVTAGTATLRPEVSIMIDTDLSEIRRLDTGASLLPIAGLVVTRLAQRGGPPLLVISLGRLELPAGVVIRARGEAAVVFAVNGDARVDGTIDAAAGEAVTPGAGGSPGQRLPGLAGFGLGRGKPCLDSTRDHCGGGGGGHGGAGGDGAAEDGNDPTTGPGGPAYGTAPLIPLTGGSGGASGGDDRNADGVGGGGGGAIQISATGVIHVAGTINVSGAGGAAGGAAASIGGGGGGGAGGGVLLEASAVTLTGRVVANGGGGGGGSCGEGGTRGAAGRLDELPAAGGLAGGAFSTAGGAGGAGMALNGGPAKSPATCAGGGGGGAAGRIHIRAATATFASAQAISPRAGLTTEAL